MVILLVFLLIALLVAVPLAIDNRDLLLDRLHGLNGVHGVHALTALTSRDRAPEGEPPLPFLIIPISHGDGDAPIHPAREVCATKSAIRTPYTKVLTRGC